MRDQDYIQRCFQLAKKAVGNTSPNPLVGAVIVKNGKIIAEGHHRLSGLPHAEAEAFINAQEDVSGATLYCNLEPCCHTNKITPPCTQAIIAKKIARVVIANLDPNPQVAGKGIKALRSAGIEVDTGILAEYGEILNEVFFTHITKKRPFIHLKWAQTLDGKLATLSGSSQWITGERAREYVHKERSLYDAIAIGAKTLELDNPSLTIRLPGKNPICKKRVIFGNKTTQKKTYKVFSDEFQDQTVLLCPKEGETSSLASPLNMLYKQGVKSLYVEGGAELLSSFLQQGLWDRLSVYIAPKLLGLGIQPIAIETPSLMSEALHFTQGGWQALGEDIVFESKRNVCLLD